MRKNRLNNMKKKKKKKGYTEEDLRKISGENDTINGIFLFVKENFPICNRKIPIVRRGE